MSQERCKAVKALLKQALDILSSGSCGTGRGVSLGITHTEDAYMRVDFHMRENGWTSDAKPAPAVPQQPLPMPTPAPATPRSTLAPAAAIPQLSTGLMKPPAVVADSTLDDEVYDMLDDVALL